MARDFVRRNIVEETLASLGVTIKKARGGKKKGLGATKKGLGGTERA
jgi:hypothetical protein